MKVMYHEFFDYKDSTYIYCRMYPLVVPPTKLSFSPVRKFSELDESGSFHCDFCSKDVSFYVVLDIGDSGYEDRCLCEKHYLHCLISEHFECDFDPVEEDFDKDSDIESNFEEEV